ncbi:hypothetical protein [Parasitella parasitica]|uniref:MULE transposase domain-containing protein n=1 Tax=Parasitella parasitica TaxID=35722 RepID=A0A0B7NEK8_9FUNG|nr:hypothetical protein [Parasitella parasitica]
MTWYNIKAMLRLDRATLANLIDCEDNNIPIALTIQYHQVYYQMKKVLQRRARLDTDFVSSINKWLLKITDQEHPIIHGFSVSRNLNEYQTGMFFVAFMSKWQLQLLAQNGDMVCFMDSTHKTFLQCNVTGKGKPLACMVTNSEAQHPIRFWLEWLKDQFGYSPSMVIMIDNSDTEIVAINLVYNRNDEVDVFNTNVKIMLCHWHIMKAWKAKILTKLVPKSGQQKSKQERQQKRSEALDCLVLMMQARDLEEFDLAFDEFEIWCRENEDWETYELIDYVEVVNYLPKKEKWSKAWRKENYNIDTNSYIETWHRHLKEVYMMNIKKQRLDVLMYYLLWDFVLPDMMQDHIRITSGVQQRQIAIETKAHGNRLLSARSIISSMSEYDPELTEANYGVATGPHMSRWAEDLRRIFNEMKSYRNNPLGNHHQNRFY